MWRDWGLDTKQRDVTDTSDRLVSVMIDVCKKETGEEVCVGGGGVWWGGEKKKWEGWEGR